MADEQLARLKEVLQKEAEWNENDVPKAGKLALATCCFLEQYAQPRVGKGDKNVS
jgi:hypothetical protein